MVPFLRRVVRRIKRPLCADRNGATKLPPGREANASEIPNVFRNNEFGNCGETPSIRPSAA